MLDRLMPVLCECTGWSAELPVEVDGGGEGEDAGGDAAEEAVRCSGEVSFESELLLERVDDRLDSLPDAADRRGWPVWLVGPAGPYEQGAELGDG